MFIRSANITGLPSIIYEPEAGKALRDKLSSQSEIRHARHQSFSAILGLAALQEFPSDELSDPDRLGVIAVGGPQHLAVVWRFLERAFAAGPMMVNPLAFPATLPSAVPTAIAAAIQAKAFALTVGYDHRATVEAIDRACRLVRADFADDVFVLVAIDSDHVIEQVVRRGSLTAPTPIATAFHVSRIERNVGCRIVAHGHATKAVHETKAMRLSGDSISSANEISDAIADLIAGRINGPVVLGTTLDKGLFGLVLSM